MTTNYLSRKYSVEAAKSFKESFSNNINRNVGYVYIAKSTPYANDNIVSESVDSVSEEKNIWDNMIAAKKVSAGDIEFVIPFYRWTANTRYKQYDDKLSLDELLSVTIANNVTIYPMYVVNSEGNVYKCLCNNVSSLSTVEPSGTYAQNQGFFQTEVSGEKSYLWKYMYNVKLLSNKFVTQDWIPVPYRINENQSEYNLNTLNLIDGGLSKIIMSNTGTGYVDTTLNVFSYGLNSSIIRVSDSIDFSVSNVKRNMSISGTGIVSGTYIQDLINETKDIILSTPTISSSNAGSITISTRIEIIGDGSETLTSVSYDNTSIKKIVVDNIGINYTRANVKIYGSGTGATARVVLPPKFGHGYNPALELGANSVMILSRIGDVDASESGIIPTDTSFRQHGLLIKPNRYGESEPVTFANANSVVTQLTNVTVLSGPEYEKNELVYQGSLDNRIFEGYVVSQTPSVIKLSNVYGNISIGLPLIGANSSKSRPVSSNTSPYFERYTGNILYNNNRFKVERSEGQAEEFKLVFQF